MPYDRQRDFRKMWRNQRGHAQGSGILFLLTFEQWLGIWLDSGHLSERGCRKGQYVMGRVGDQGPYSVTNVKIITVEQNHAESWSRPFQRSSHGKRMRSRRGEARNTGVAPGLHAKYKNHKGRAARQGIGFEFTFKAWLKIWYESGHLENRGPGAEQYVMARIGDVGPYKVGNVKIITRRANIAERRFSVTGLARIGASSSEAMLRRWTLTRYVWITNGTQECRVVPGVSLPEGWWRGRVLAVKAVGKVHSCACACGRLIPMKSIWHRGHCNRGRARPDASIRMKAYNESRRAG